MIWQKKKTGVVFLREDNEFKEFIEKVKNFSESVYGEPREELDKKISLWEAGCKGENDTKYHLQYGRMDMYVLRDIYLKAGDISAQIDYLLITRKYVYLLECKNWTGTVTVDKTGRFFKSNEPTLNEPVASPIVQSDQHLKVVETLGEKLGEKLNSRYRILVIFTNNKIHLNTRSARQADIAPIVYLEQLNTRLQKDDNMAGVKNLSDKEMKKIAEFFLEHQAASSYYAEKYEELEKKYPKQTEEEILKQKEAEIARQKEGVIFLREDNEFKEFIEKVKNFSETVDGEPREELNRKISLWEAECKGEDDTKYHLQYSKTDMYVLRDIYLKAGDISAQIDYLLITRKYVYLLECKNWTGAVTVNKAGRFFKSTESPINEPVTSPIVQSDQHLKVVETIGEKLGEKLNSRYKSLVIFTNNKIRLYADSAKIVCLEQLNNRLQEDDSMAEVKKLSDKEMKEIAEFFLNQQTASSYYAEKYEELEKKYPKQTEEEILRQKQAEIARQKKAEDAFLRKALYKFRWTVCQAEDIQPYYVMNNQAIEELLKKKPRTKEELLEVKGFGHKNVAKYGTAILYILNTTIKTEGEKK